MPYRPSNQKSFTPSSDKRRSEPNQSPSAIGTSQHESNRNENRSRMLQDEGGDRPSSGRPSSVKNQTEALSNAKLEPSDNLHEQDVKEKAQNRGSDVVGQNQKAVIDKFTEPVTKDKIHNPAMQHIGQSHHATVDKFHNPVLKDKIKKPAVDHIGQKHTAIADKFTEPVLKDYKVRTPSSEHVGQKHNATIDKFHQPQLTGSIKTACANRNDWGKAAPKGDFQWVCENGTWKKDYGASSTNFDD